METSGDKILKTLRQIIRAIDLHSKSLTKIYGLTGPQLLVLKEFYKDSKITVGEVARKVSLSQATVTSILDRLEKQSFVTRIRGEEDKRKVHIRLSERSIEILSSNPSLLQEEFIKRYDQLQDWEKTLLISSLQRVASMMNAENIDSPPVLVSGPLAATEKDVQTFLDDN